MVPVRHSSDGNEVSLRHTRRSTLSHRPLGLEAKNTNNGRGMERIPADALTAALTQGPCYRGPLLFEDEGFQANGCVRTPVNLESDAAQAMDPVQVNFQFVHVP